MRNYEITVNRERLVSRYVTPARKNVVVGSEIPNPFRPQDPHFPLTFEIISSAYAFWYADTALENSER